MIPSLVSARLPRLLTTRSVSAAPAPAPAQAPAPTGDRWQPSAASSRLTLPAGGAPAAPSAADVAAMIAQVQQAIAQLEAQLKALEAALPAQPAQPQAPATGLPYTTRYDHPVSELADQLATDADTLMALNGWNDPAQVVPAGTAIRVPDTQATRDMVAQYTGPAPSPAPAPTPQPSRPAATVGDPMSYFFCQFQNDRFNPTGPSSSSNCGPASLAMALKAFGLTDGSDVEATIEKTRQAMTGSNDIHSGTDVSQVVQGAHAFGAQAQAVSGLGAVEQALADGKLVVAAGDPVVYEGRFTGAQTAKYDGGHFILVVGRDADGNFLVNDPLSRVGTLTITRDELQGYLAYQGWNSAVAVWR